jgi:hypothetical protein
MSQQYDNTSRFVLFKNEKKRDDKDADFNGTINIEGVDYWLNAYATVDGNKLKRINGKIGKRKEARQEGSGQRTPAKTSDDDFDSEIPF